MDYLLLLICLLTLLAWAAFWRSPGHRALRRFVYNRATNPAALTGVVSHDTAPAAYAGDPAVWPAVTVILAGRNEGHHLEQTLGSICRMNYPRFRVVFVDDHSTDATPAITAALSARYAHLTVLRNEQDPPPGWVGKVWAIHQAWLYLARHHTQGIPALSSGANGGGGDYLLFTDADLLFHPDCLTQMIRLALHRQTDLLSLLPRVDAPTLSEQLLMLAAMVLIITSYPLHKSNDPRDKAVLTAGGFLLFKRATYEAIGTHEAVRRQMIEDLALGTLTKSRGFRIFTVATQELLHGRMYEGARDTFHSMQKNAYAGADYSPIKALGGILVLAICGALMPLWPLAAIVRWTTAPSIVSFLACAAACAGAVLMLRSLALAARLLQFPWWIAWLSPLSAAAFIAILAASMREYYRGGNEWSGRKYAPAHLTPLTHANRPPKA